MVILKCEIKRPSSVFHGPGHITPGQGLPRTEKGGHPRQTAKFLFVYDDHPRHWGFRSLVHVSRRVQPPFGIPQPGLYALELAAEQ
jgi:hypothetical protein